MKSSSTQNNVVGNSITKKSNIKKLSLLTKPEDTGSKSISKQQSKNYYSLKTCNFISSKPRVGSYAQTSSSNSRPWTKKRNNPTRKTKKKKVLHPIFTQCAKLTTDRFWKNLFEKASFGKFLRGYTINREYLIYKRGSKSDSVFIPNSPHEAYSVCVSFFQSTANIYSDEDLKKIREEQRLIQLQEQLREKTWSKTLKRQKEVLIEAYIFDLKKKYSLGVEQGKKLEDLIKIGLLYNYFNKDNIILDNGIISDIKGLKYDETKGEFTTLTEMKPKTNKSSSKSRKLEPSPLPSHVEIINQRKLNFQEEWRKLIEQTMKDNIFKDKKSEIETQVEVTRVASPTPSNRYTDDVTEYTPTPTEVTDIISTLDS